MSAGDFVKVGYRPSYDVTRVHPIRVQPETVTAVNTVADSAINSPISCHATPRRRRLGLFARFITVRPVPPAVIPDGYKGGNLRVVIFDPIVFNSIQVGSQFTYLGSAMTVQSKNPEVVR